jgi:hypothetical protein
MAKYQTRIRFVEAWQVGSDEPVPEWAGGEVGGKDSFPWVDGVWLVLNEGDRPNPLTGSRVVAYHNDEFTEMYEKAEEPNPRQEKGRLRFRGQGSGGER